MPSTQTTLRIDRSQSGSVSKLLFRYTDDALQEAAHELLERDSLTDDEIRDFCYGSRRQQRQHQEALPAVIDDVRDAASTTAPSLKQRYRTRRREIHSLVKLLPSGGAHIGPDGRLLRVADPERRFVPPLAPLPPLVPAAHNHPANPPRNHNLDAVRPNRVDERAAADIARAVARYRRAGVPDADLHHVRVRPAVAAVPADNQRPAVPGVDPAAAAAAAAAGPPPALRNNNNINNFLTIRRIAVAVFVVTSAILTMMLQNPPLSLQNGPQRSVIRDDVHDAVLQVKHLLPHALHCGGAALHRAPASSRHQNGSSGRETPIRIRGVVRDSTIWNALCRRVMEMQTTLSAAPRWLRDYAARSDPVVDCSDGVLHLPSPTVMARQFLATNSARDVALLAPFIAQGVNTTWFMPCRPPPGTLVFPDGSCPVKTSSLLANQPSLAAAEPSQHCFRGVHDNYVADEHVHDAIRWGEQLILHGGDHFDIHYDVKVLTERLPAILQSLHKLLRDRYLVDAQLRPVAYRVSAVGPMDGEGVELPGRQPSLRKLPRLFNRTRYVQWMAAAGCRNAVAQLPLPWPFHSIVKPSRDTCNLMADLEADPAFAVHTTVFLSEGAGEEYRGGVALFVDYDDELRRRRNQKIRRGISIDGSRGRVVVSTGGLENRRCRLPTRAGIRATLQIWWSTR